MDIMGIIMLVLTYTLIGFGFACGFALFRWVSAKRKSNKKKKSGSTAPQESQWERIRNRIP